MRHNTHDFPSKENRLIFENLSAAERLPDDEAPEKSAKSERPAGAPLPKFGAPVRTELTLKNPGRLNEAVHNAIANEPASVFVKELERDGKAEELQEILMPYCIEQLEAYAKEKDPAAADFAKRLLPSERFCLAMLYAKDAATAIRSLDVYILASRAIAKIPQLAKLTPDEKFVLLKSCLLHDVGKQEVPDVVLKNPIGKEIPDIFKSYLAERNRPPVKSPVDLSETEKKKFRYLLENPRSLTTEMRVNLAEEFTALCRKSGANFKTAIPTSYLLRKSSDMLESGKGDPETTEKLKPQQHALRDFRHILQMYGIPDDESFQDTLDRHEAVSLTVIADADRNLDETLAREYDETLLDQAKEAKNLLARILHLISRHHNNPITVRTREKLQITSKNPPPQGDELLAKAIRIADIIAALQQERPYHKPKTPAEINSILKKEIEKGRLDPNLTEAFIHEFFPESK